MKEFLNNNWLSVLSILIGIFVAYVFYRLQRKDSLSATVERKKHATTELLDVVESYIINKQRLSENLIENLIHASERDRLVELRPGCTAISLLQDVALRLQRSRHLDIPQKSEYSEKIDQLILEISKQRQSVPIQKIDSNVSVKLIALEQLIPEDKKEEASPLLHGISEFMKEQSLRIARIEKRTESAKILTTALLGTVAAAITTVLGTSIFSTSMLSSTIAPSTLITAMAAFTAVVVVVDGFRTALRIKRRSKKIVDS